MKVSVYDSTGGLIGVAWHENDFGLVQLPPATRDCTATHFAINDGKLQPLPYATRVPVDAELKLRIHPPRLQDDDDFFARALRQALGVHDFGDGVDEKASKMSWWRRLKGILK